jgi:hypothetical protein
VKRQKKRVLVTDGAVTMASNAQRQAQRRSTAGR